MSSCRSHLAPHSGQVVTSSTPGATPKRSYPHPGHRACPSISLRTRRTCVPNARTIQIRSGSPTTSNATPAGVRSATASTIGPNRTAANPNPMPHPASTSGGVATPTGIALTPLNTRRPGESPGSPVPYHSQYASTRLPRSSRVQQRRRLMPAPRFPRPGTTATAPDPLTLSSARMPKPPTITPAEADLAYAAAQKVVEMHHRLSDFLRPGQTLAQIDTFVGRSLEEMGCRSCFQGYTVPRSPPFPSHACLSVNECVVHGTAGYYTAPMKQGDLLKIDIGVRYKGWIGDAAWTYSFGKPSPVVQRLMQCGKDSI